MSKYKLVYFQIGGRAEPIRYMLHYAGQPFEDKRIELEDWHAGKVDKSAFKYGQLPVLEIDEGKQIAQTATIMRYLADKFGLAGKNAFEKAKVDELYELYRDFIEKIIDYVGTKAGWRASVGWRVVADVDKLREECFLPNVAHFYPYFESLLAGSVNGFLMPSGITYVDFVLAFMGDFLPVAVDEPDMFKPYLHCAAHIQRVRALPQLQKYLHGLPPNYHKMKP